MSINSRLCLDSLEARDVPAGDLAYALQLTGLPASANLRVAADPVGNTYVTGTFTGTLDLDPTTTGVTNVTSKGGTDVFVAKYSVTGQLVWGKSLGGTANETVADIAFDGAGSVYTGGTFQGAVDFNPNPAVTATMTAAEGGSGYVWKLDFYGNLFMARTIDGTSTISALAVDAGGNITTTGIFQGTTDFDPTDAGTTNLTTTNTSGAAFAWKLASNGSFAWAKKFETSGMIEMPNVAVDGAGNTYIAGSLTGLADLDPSDTTKASVAVGTAMTPFIVKLSGPGDFVWARAVRTVTEVTGATNKITGLGIDSIGNVYAAGVFAGAVDFDPSAGTATLTSAGGVNDGFVMKFDGAGNFRWARQFGGASAETISDLFVDKAGNTYTTGTFTGVADFDPGAGTATLVSGAGASDGYVLKLSNLGNLMYTRVLGGGASTTKPTTIWADGAGNMTVAGTFVGLVDFDPAASMALIDGGTSSGFIVRLSPKAGSTPGPVNTPPINVWAGGPYAINEGQGVTLTASATDLNKDVLKFTWDLNGDGVFGDAFGTSVTLTSAQMAVLGLADGTGVPKTIRLRVKDGINLPAEGVATLTINNLAPTAKLVAPAKGKEGFRPLITVVPTSDASAADWKAGMRYSYDFNDDGVWDLGNGTTYAGSVVTSSLKVPALFLPDSGPIAVRVRVFDKDGGYVDKTATIDLENQAPTATFSMLGGVAYVGKQMTFVFTNPVDSPLDKQAGFTYGFDFNNDGVFEVQSKTPTATITFPSRGTYTIKGAIADAEGAFTVYTLTVNVPF
jgi:Beta-propeller repeat